MTATVTQNLIDTLVKAGAVERAFPSKAYVTDVLDALTDGMTSRETAWERLWQAHVDGRLELSRADLPVGLDQERLQGSPGAGTLGSWDLIKISS